MKITIWKTVWIALLTFSLACDGDGMDGAETDSGTDADVADVDAAGDDGGPAGPTVTVGALAALTGTSDSFPRMAILRSAVSGEVAFGFSGTAVQQPGGPSQLGLEEERVVLGWNDARGRPFEWLTYDLGGSSADRSIGSDSNSMWLHYEADAPGWLGEERVTGPVVVRWSRDGTSERWSVPAGLRLRYMGVGSGGERWLLGLGDGSIVVDGSPLGEADTNVLFVAEMDDGLTDPKVIASTAEEVPLLPEGLALPSGQLLVRFALVSGEVFGDSVTDYHRLVRVDPAAEAATGDWEAERLAIRSREDGLVELHLPITERTTFGAGTYEPFPRFGEWDDPETWIRVLWDGAGEVPEGERLAMDPELLGTGDVRVTRTVERVAQLGADGSIARWLTADNGMMIGVTPVDGKLWVQLIGNGNPLSLRIEEADGVRTEPLESARLAEGLWLVELDPATGSILRRRSFDVGPPGLVDFDRREGFAWPLSGDRILVATRPAGQAVSDLRVVHWSEAGETTIEATVTGPGCSASVQSPTITLRTSWTADPSVVQLYVLCDGPHRVELAGGAFDHAGPRSANLFRVVVD